MVAPWSAEIEVGRPLARDLIEEQFSALAPAHVEPGGFGWDNTAYRVNLRYIFRFPRRAIAVELLDTERRSLPVMATHLSLPVPVPIFAGQPGERYPWPFLGYEELPGRTADVVHLSREARMRTAAPLARFLAALHGLRPDLNLTLPPDRLGRCDISKRLPQLESNLTELASLGLIADAKKILNCVGELPTADSQRPAAVVHGDLYARHLLVNGVDDLCGVIDWGDLHFGDPAVDLAIAHSFLPPEAHTAFRTAYGFIDAAAWSRARFRALYHASVTALYAHKTGDADLFDESLTALSHITGSKLPS